MKAGVMVQAVERAIKIMECFTKGNSELRLREISDELQLNKSTVHGILNTLKHYGYVDQDEETQKYRLGFKILEIGGHLVNSLDVRNVASPILRELSVKTGETVHLVVLDGREVVYIDKVESNQSIRIATSIGARYPAHCTGVGKAILAHKKFEELDTLLPNKLDKLTEQTITDKKALFESLRQIQQSGYAFDNEENTEGLRCVGAPIFDHRGKVVAGISVAGPSVRMSEEWMNQLVKMVCETAQQISARLGYQMIK